MAVVDESQRVEAAVMADAVRMMRWLRIVPLAILAIGFVIQLFDPGKIVSTIQFQVFDFYQRQAPRIYEDPLAKTGTTIRFLDIDEASLAEKSLGQWPWPRTVLAQMLDRLKAAGTKAVIFDIQFSESDRTSPESMLLNLPTDEGWADARSRIGALESHDVVFARSIGEMPVVTGFILNSDKPVEGRPLPALKPSIIFRGDTETVERPEVVRWLNRYSGWSATLPGLEENAKGNGALNTVTDADGIIRRVPILLRAADEILPSISVEAVRVISGLRRLMIFMAGADDEANLGGSQGIISVVAGKTKIPTTYDGQMWVHFTTAQAERKVSALEVLGPNWSVEALGTRVKDAIVFVGTSAAGLRDLRATPLEGEIAGVEIHAMAAEQMLLGHFLERPDWIVGLERVLALVLGLFVIFGVRFLSAFWVGLVAVAAIAAAFGFSWWGYLDQRLLIDPVAPSIVLGLVLASAGIVKLMETEAERRAVRSAMSQYLPPSVVEEIARDPSKLRLGGDTRELTIKFADIRGFTAIAETFRTDPMQLTRLINRVLTPLSRTILDMNGTIDKYIGDCIMAFWNAPLDDPNHVSNACECALRMQAAIQKLNEQLDAEGFYKAHPIKRIAVGIGLNTGSCVVGNMGSDIRFDYSALGDAVNLASRYQSLSGQYGSYIVVGEDTEKRVADKFTFMEIDYLIVKGRADPATLYALMGDPSYAQRDDFKILNGVLQRLFKALRSRDWAGARAAISEGRQLPETDQTIFDTYEKRVDGYEESPPHDDWNGAWKATEK